MGLLTFLMEQVKFGDFKELTKSIFTDIIKSIQEMIIKMTVAQTMQYAMQSAGFGGGYSDKGSFSFSDFWICKRWSV